MAIKIPYLLIEPYIFLYVSSQILNVIIVPQLLLDNECKLHFNTTVCSNIYSSQYKVEQDAVQKKSALWLTALYTSLSVLNLLTIPFLGPLANTIGAQKAMYLSPFFMGVQCIVCIILTTSGQSFTTALLLLAIPILAFSGNYSGALMFACSYIADTTLDRNRTFRMSLLDSAYSFASALFSFASGFILLQFGYTGGFVVSLCICIINIIYLKWFVPDPRLNQKSKSTSAQNELARCSRDAIGLDEGELILQNECSIQRNSIVGEDKNIANGSSISIKVNTKNSNEACENKCSDTATSKKTLCDILVEANPYTNFKKLHRILGAQKQSHSVFFLLIAAFSSMLAWSGEFTLLVIFLKGRPLNFSETDIGYLLAVQSIMWAFVGYILLNFIIQRFLKCSDTIVIFVCLGTHGVYFILLSLSTSKSMIYLIQLLSAVAALDIPCIRSTLTKRVSPDAYGTILACCATSEVLGSLVGIFGSTIIYAEFLTFHRGVGFFFIAFFPILASLLIAGLYWKEHKLIEKKTMLQNSKNEIVLRDISKSELTLANVD